MGLSWVEMWGIAGRRIGGFVCGCRVGYRKVGSGGGGGCKKRKSGKAFGNVIERCVSSLVEV